MRQRASAFFRIVFYMPVVTGTVAVTVVWKWMFSRYNGLLNYVLRALGRSDELAHSSIRFTLGRFTPEEEIDYTIRLLHEKIAKLRELSPLWEMFKDGIDLDSVQWAAH